MIGFGEVLPDGSGMKLPWRRRLVFLGLALSLIALLALYVLEFWWMDNTIDIATLAWVAAGVALVAGLLLGLYVARYERDAFDRFRMVMIVASLCTLFGPFFGSLSNRLLAGPVHYVEVPVRRVEAFAQSRLGFIKGERIEPQGYYLFVWYGDELERLRFRSLPEPPPVRGQSIRLPVRRGLWGFEVVLPFDSQTSSR